MQFPSNVNYNGEIHDDVIKWKHFLRYWTFVWGIHRSPVKHPHKGQWRGALMFSLICILNKRLSKQLWGWWFETLSRSFWRHCNAFVKWTPVQWEHRKTGQHPSPSHRLLYRVELYTFIHGRAVGVRDLCVTAMSESCEVRIWLKCQEIVSSWWRHQVEAFSALLGFCAGNSPVTGEFPSQRPVTRSYDVSSPEHTFM